MATSPMRPKEGPPPIYPHAYKYQISPPKVALLFFTIYIYIPNYERKHPTINHGSFRTQHRRKSPILIIPNPKPQKLTKKQPKVLLAQETSADQIFPTFTADTAWQLGNALRDRILRLPEGQRKPALVSIALSGGAPLHVVFQSATESGTIPDNENWVRRKRNTVLRFGVSSWAMRQKTVSGLAAGASADDVEAAFVSKYAIPSATGGSVADEYAIHGGAYPIRVRGVDGIIGVVVVSGLKQEDDHQVVAETIQAFVAQQAK